MSHAILHIFLSATNILCEYFRFRKDVGTPTRRVELSYHSVNFEVSVTSWEKIECSGACKDLTVRTRSSQPVLHQRRPQRPCRWPDKWCGKTQDWALGRVVDRLVGATPTSSIIFTLSLTLTIYVHTSQHILIVTWPQSPRRDNCALPSSPLDFSIIQTHHIACPATSAIFSVLQFLNQCLQKSQKYSRSPSFPWFSPFPICLPCLQHHKRDPTPTNQQGTHPLNISRQARSCGHSRPRPPLELLHGVLT